MSRPVDATVPALELALRRGYGVVSANKLPLTADQATFDRFAGSQRFRYESTLARRAGDRDNPAV